VVDLDVVRRQYASLPTALPGTEMFYAVKANPAPEVLGLLIKLGSNFDVASRGEIELCLGLGADPARLSYCDTVKKERDIGAASGSLPSRAPGRRTGSPDGRQAAGHRHETRQSRC
jgi:ornithine decarboxylase